LRSPVKGRVKVKREAVEGNLIKAQRGEVKKKSRTGFPWGGGGRRS